MDYMLDPPDDPPGPTEADIEAARERIVQAAFGDPAILLEQVDNTVLMEVYEGLRSWTSLSTDAQKLLIHQYIAEIERSLFTERAINAELDQMAEENRNEYDGPDPDDRIDEALAWGGRNYP